MAMARGEGAGGGAQRGRVREGVHSPLPCFAWKLLPQHNLILPAGVSLLLINAPAAPAIFTMSEIHMKVYRGILHLFIAARILLASLCIRRAVLFLVSISASPCSMLSDACSFS